jgi:hypothetical protein
MNEKLPSALAKRLAAYSATAAVTLAVASEAGAQVVYRDLKPDREVNIDGRDDAVLDIDLDGDGADDIRLIACGSSYPGCGFDRYYTYNVVLRRAAAGQALNGVLGYDAPNYGDPAVGGASRLSSGAPVGPAGPGRGFYPYGILGTGFGPSQAGHYPFNGQEGYAGFRFGGGDGALHYGWIRASAGAVATVGALYEYAYESAPDTPIAAGDYAVGLTGTVDRRRFGADGGTLRGTAALENVTDDPVSLDLWIEARSGGAEVFSALLESIEVPAGATVSRPLAVPIPADAPNVRYHVRLKVGDFETGAFVSFQEFDITKGIPRAADESDPAAEASAAGLAGTHALSEAVPNPSDGRTALTLFVAEAQVVRVEVLDALGRRVALLHDGPMAAGTEHRLAFDGSALPVGVYVVRAMGAAFADTRVLTLTR